MKILISTTRIFVSLIFILSGSIKLNDHRGFAYKLDEYFGYEVFNLPFLLDYTLLLSLFISLLEIILGGFLLIGFKNKFTLKSLIAILIAFGFLTFYSAYFEKVTDCGCFGDALKLTPWQSFFKDILLLVLCVFLYRFQTAIKPILTHKYVIITLSLYFLFWMFFTVYALNNLPVIDFRPYKVGSNIIENMRIPNDAPKDVYKYEWIFKVQDKDTTITTLGEYPDLKNSVLKTVHTTLIKKGYTPPITDFNIEKDGQDHTEKILNEDAIILFVAYDLSKSDDKGLERTATLIKQLKTKGIPFAFLTASYDITIQAVTKKYALENICFYKADMKTLKTIIRGNPSLIYLKQGTIIQKLNHTEYNDLAL